MDFYRNLSSLNLYIIFLPFTIFSLYYNFYSAVSHHALFFVLCYILCAVITDNITKYSDHLTVFKCMKFRAFPMVSTFRSLTYVME
jgi:hypothetical protein